MRGNREMVKMSTLIKDISMGPFGSDIKVECMVDAGVPLLDGSNLTAVRMNDNSLKYVTRKKADSLKKALAHPFDIVVTHRGTIGQISYVPDDLHYNEFLISQSQFRVTLDTNTVNPIYFTYYFHTAEGQKRLLSFANYVGVPALASATTNFRELDFPLITLSEQNAIADLLLSLDDKIRLNKAILSELEGLVKLLFDYWFVQFDFPDDNGKPYKSTGGKMVWNDALKREVPVGWEVRPLCELFDITMGSSPDGTSLNDSGKGVEFYQGSTDFGDVYPTIRVFTTKPVRFANAQDVLMSVRAPVGDLNIAMNDCCIGRGLAAIHHKSTMFAWCTMQTLKPYFEVFNNNGTTFGALTADDLKGLLVISPTERVLQLFMDLVDSIGDELRSITLESRQLASLRDFLLPMLMNGQVKVNN